MYFHSDVYSWEKEAKFIFLSEKPEKVQHLNELIDSFLKDESLSEVQKNAILDDELSFKFQEIKMAPVAWLHELRKNWKRAENE